MCTHGPTHIKCERMGQEGVMLLRHYVAKAFAVVKLTTATPSAQ